MDTLLYGIQEDHVSTAHGEPVDQESRLQETVFYEFILALASSAPVLPTALLRFLTAKRATREKETHPRDSIHPLPPTPSVEINMGWEF